jgi:hypothetical protein
MKTLRHVRRDGIIGLNTRRTIEKENVETMEGDVEADAGFKDKKNKYIMINTDHLELTLSEECRIKFFMRLIRAICLDNYYNQFYHPYHKHVHNTRMCLDHCCRNIISMW